MYNYHAHCFWHCIGILTFKSNQIQVENLDYEECASIIKKLEEEHFFLNYQQVQPLTAVYEKAGM